ncbi:MAG TPA: hypothetical protein PKO22_11630 [Treponemataceae bacterium]|nr:hypothetical protein [Treponemataceae bacterium]
MVEPSSFYTRLADREGFNTSVRHINNTLDLLDMCNPKNNLADVVNTLLSDKEIDSGEVHSIANMLLVEKWKYKAASHNITAITDDPTLVSTETGKWKAVDLIIGYHHPDLGFLLINPKNPESAAVIAGFRKNELMVVYAGTQGDGKASESLNAALDCLINLVEGKKAKAPAALLSGSFAYVPPKKANMKKTTEEQSRKSPRAAKSTGKAVMPAKTATIYTGPSVAQAVASSQPAHAAPAPAPVSVPGASKMSPLVSVVVSNELFHNGNVEAWKRIIRSYNAKYPALQVFIYYDGERIVDINTLFKWGKVKHGSCIQFSVAGENIQDLAKLSRYFRQGASPSFEAFLHGSPDTVMNLF